MFGFAPGKGKVSGTLSCETNPAWIDVGGDGLVFHLFWGFGTTEGSGGRVVGSSQDELVVVSLKRVGADGIFVSAQQANRGSGDPTAISDDHFAQIFRCHHDVYRRLRSMTSTDNTFDSLDRSTCIRCDRGYVFQVTSDVWSEPGRRVQVRGLQRQNRDGGEHVEMATYGSNVSRHSL